MTFICLHASHWVICHYSKMVAFLTGSSTYFEQMDELLDEWTDGWMDRWIHGDQNWPIAIIWIVAICLAEADCCRWSADCIPHQLFKLSSNSREKAKVPVQRLSRVKRELGLSSTFTPSTAPHKVGLCVHRTVEQVIGQWNAPSALFSKVHLYLCGCEAMLCCLETCCLWSDYLSLMTDENLVWTYLLWT